jgi:hypothetical protein
VTVSCRIDRKAYRHNETDAVMHCAVMDEKTTGPLPGSTYYGHDTSMSIVDLKDVNRRGVAVCGHCGSRERPNNKFKKCSACKVVYYCSRNCQKHNWSNHKTQCKSLRLSKKEAREILNMSQYERI